MDSQLSSKGVFFLPWVGEKYESQTGGARLLILGESHYSDAEGETPELTRQCVSEHAQRIWNHRFFTMLTQLVSGEDHWDIDRSEFWNNVCLYNYVQRSVAEGPGIAPVSADFIDNENAFRAVVSCLRPTHILVCSWRLWDSLPTTLFEPNLAQSIDRFEARRMMTSPSVLSMGIPHPSRATRAPVTDVIRQFLKAQI
jgi:hypothetical protein